MKQIETRQGKQNFTLKNSGRATDTIMARHETAGGIVKERGHRKLNKMLLGKKLATKAAADVHVDGVYMKRLTALFPTGKQTLFLVAVLLCLWRRQ